MFTGVGLLFFSMSDLQPVRCAASQVIAWGDNAFGQTNVPADLTNAIAISGGQNFSVGLRADGTVVAWGDNSSGQTDVPADLSNVVAIAAGGYQLSPLKAACVRQCRSPVHFITRHWQPGPAGAVRLGVVHGAYCLGCCWLLMALLFVGGIMNPLWIAGLTIMNTREREH